MMADLAQSGLLGGSIAIPYFERTVDEPDSDEHRLHKRLHLSGEAVEHSIECLMTLYASYHDA